MALKITFVSIPAINASIEFDWDVNFPTPPPFYFNRSNIFKTTRVNPGEVTIGSTLEECAENYRAAFVIDYGGAGTFYVTRVGTSVFIQPEDGSTLVNEESSSPFVIFTEEDFPYEISITNPYGEIAFTLDPKYFLIESTIANTYYRINSQIRVFQFNSSSYKVYPKTNRIVPLNGVAEFNIGQIVHKLMERFPSINDDVPQYNLALVDISVNQFQFGSNDSIANETIPQVAFIAGIENDFDTFGFLTNNHQPERVTKNLFKYLNFYVPGTGYQMVIHKNGVPLSGTTITAGGIQTIKAYFNTFAQGDVIDYYLQQTSDADLNNAKKKTFKIFPEGDQSMLIVWEDDFLLKQSIECTGEFSTSSELDIVTFKQFKRLVNELVSVTTLDDMKLRINTGFLMNSDINTVRSLMRSKRAFLVIETKVIHLTPITKPITNTDSTRQLIDFNLEFTINKDFNEQDISI